MHEALVCNISALPRASDPDAAERGLEDWRRVAQKLASPLDERAAALADDANGRRLLSALFGNSPFLTQCALQQAACLLDVVQVGPDAAFDKLFVDLVGELKDAADREADVTRILRRARQRNALLVAVADIAGAWDGTRVTGALSQFAETAVSHAVDHLLRQGASAGDLDLADPEAPGTGSGWIVLGMGKLGGRELNYSSDIDLIVLYDRDHTPYCGSRDCQDFFVRLTQRLARLLEDRTGDGYVFRTDLRLRPDPAATPPAVSVLAAESYYASLGQNWERAAMIKARPIAGDIAAGDAFLHAIRPFIWRKHLDFAAIQDIHSIKRQIRSHRGGGNIAVLGHNIKLGRGGIREIEFFAQTQQLIWGGRYQSLRGRRTEEAIKALRELERISAEAETDLIEAYWFLRRVEHRLQMVNDAQVHSVPQDDEGVARLAVFLGYPDAATFARVLTDYLTRVSDHSDSLFEDAPGLGAPTPQGGNLSFTSADDDPGTLETLEEMGFRQARTVSQSIRAWHHGRLRATRSTRARQLLTELTPTLLTALGQTANPDQAFARFDAFLGNLPAGVPLFSLFQAAPKLLDLIAEIVGSTPRIADYLSRHAELLDAVLAQGFYDALPPKDQLRETLAHELTDANDLQDRLEIARKWGADAKFQVSVQRLLGIRGFPEAARALTDIADVLIEAMLDVVTDEFALRHGRFAEGGLAVLGLGKLGGRLLARGSDLDLVFVYQAPGPNAVSDGDRPLSPPVYYARLCQRLITALTVQTGSGLLYEVDMRLRPMGADGPLATEIAAFERYYREDAWTWELMALTRSRPVTGPDDLVARIEMVVADKLRQQRDPTRLAVEVRDMRERMAKEHRTNDPFAIKHVRGGLVDIEFIVQYLQLRDAAEKPEVLCTGTLDALAALARAGSIDAGHSECLISAADLFYNIQAMRRLSLSGDFDENSAPEGLRRALCRAAALPDFRTLKATLVDMQARVHKCFVDLIGSAARDVTSDEIDDRKETN